MASPLANTGKLPVSSSKFLIHKQKTKHRHKLVNLGCVNQLTDDDDDDEEEEEEEKKWFVSRLSSSNGG